MARTRQPAFKQQAFPADPADRLAFVLEFYFNNSPKALADAAGITRALVHKWPPVMVSLMDQHILRALDSELAAAEMRVIALTEARAGLSELIAKQSHADARRLKGM